MLTDTECRKAKAGERPAKLTDSGGLYLHVTPAGGKHWRCRYEFGARKRPSVRTQLSASPRRALLVMTPKQPFAADAIPALLNGLQRPT